MPDTARQSPTRIAPDTIVHGTVETAGDLLVEGRVEGEIRCGGVLDVALGATCMADVHARRAEIHGEVLGRTSCHEAISVAAGGRVVGDLRAPDIAVDGAARVEGRVDLLPPEPDARAIRSVSLTAAGMARPTDPTKHGQRDETAQQPSVFDGPAARPPSRGATTDGDSVRVVPRPPRPQGRVRLAKTSPT